MLSMLLDKLSENWISQKNTAIYPVYIKTKTNQTGLLGGWWNIISNTVNIDLWVPECCSSYLVQSRLEYDVNQMLTIDTINITNELQAPDSKLIHLI